MPVLKLHFPEELVSQENFEDVLLQVNKEPGANFKSRDEWMRTTLRSYIVASLNGLRRWETTRYLSTLTGQVHVPTLEFWEGDVEGLDDEEEGALVGITIGKLQSEYLRTITKWENTYQREIVKSGVEHGSVAALARFIILNALLMAQARVDEERLMEEEREILADEAKANSAKGENL